MRYIILLFPLLVGCETNITSNKTDYKIGGESIDILIIDGCEYLMCRAGASTWCTHKGNCKNH